MSSDPDPALGVRDQRPDAEPVDGAEPLDGAGRVSGTPSWARIVVAIAAVVALLLVGAAAGLLIAQTRASDPATTPAADSVAVGFCQDMSVHHRQAVLMAGLARDRTTDLAVKHIAFDIETNQLEQIGRMQGWLNLWGRDPIPVGGHMAWMSGPSHGDEHPGSGAVLQMPGMASQDELNQLQKATGKDFDILFLQLMLHHHQGGAGMLRYAADHAEVGVVRNLAAQMATAQSMESDLLTSMITERGASPLPAPN
jgi:uncharacterized protein (DUF305 family)